MKARIQDDLQKRYSDTETSKFLDTCMCSFIDTRFKAQYGTEECEVVEKVLEEMEIFVNQDSDQSAEVSNEPPKKGKFP